MNKKKVAEEIQAKLDYIEKMKCEKSFYEFVRVLWRYADPTEFIPSWHIEAICTHLEAVHHGAIKRLIINIPPRSAKSLICSVLYPAWVWVKNPAHRFLTGSHALNLTIRDTRRSRLVIQSPVFQKHWGSTFSLAYDQNQKSRYNNDYEGSRIAFSVGGQLIGEGGDTIIVDDPINGDDMLNKQALCNVNEWYSNALITRLNDQRKSSIIIIMQRLNQLDLSGYLLELDDSYVHICYPMEFENHRKSETAWYKDPRTEDGEILWEGIDRESLDSFKKILGPFSVAGQLQQRPALEEGSIIKKADIEYYHDHPGTFSNILCSWDTAFKAGEKNDYSAMTLWGIKEGKIYLIDIWRGKVEFPDLKKKYMEISDKWNPNYRVVEDKGSGQSLIQEFANTKYAATPYRPLKDKVERLHAVTDKFRSKSVLLPANMPMMIEFVDELCTFPMSAHDDLVDTVTQALSYIHHNDLLSTSETTVDMNKFNKFVNY